MMDIHTHLYWESYDVDRDAVIVRAREAGVKELFVIGCTVEESRQCVALADKYPDIYASIGVHPHEMNHLVENPKLKLQMPNKTQSSKNQIEEWMTELRELAKHEKAVAIGECGLDYFAHDATKKITEEQKAVQKAGFLAQISLAQELHLPVVVHCRPSVGTQDAYEDMFAILSESTFNIQHSPFILHCYMGDTEITKRFLTLPNVYFSFTGNITYPVKKALIGTKDDLGETVKLIPLDRIFAETDCPFLAPQSHRGKRNEPAFVVETLATAALLQGRTKVEVERVIAENFHTIFPQL
ncbi:MAG: TatD family hydrolase [Candidatus Moranbacteria bacterium]|nr:TatD family hydrolase [Candidatus Moranbacteria bacterium]